MKKSTQIADTKRVAIVKASLVSYPVRASVMGEREGKIRALEDNKIIENLPATYEIVEPTPLSLYCPQIADPRFRARKSPWRDGTEPFGNYHSIRTCRRHQPTDVLQKEEEVLIRNPASCKEARRLNHALQRAMMQKQRLTTDQMTRQMTGWITDEEREELGADVNEPDNPNNLLSFAELYRKIWGSRSSRGWKCYHTLSPIVAEIQSSGNDGYGNFYIGHGEILSRVMEPRRRDCPLPLAVGTVQQMLAEASDEVHGSELPVLDFGTQPRDHIIDELATTDNFHVVAYHKERMHNSRDTYDLSKPMTRVIQNADNTFKMRIDITVAILLCEHLPEPEEDHNGDIYEKAYEPSIDGPLDEDQAGHTLLCFSLGFGIHIDIADISPRAGKSKFYSQNDYACYAWEDFYNSPINVNRILKVIEQRPPDQRPGVIRFMVNNYHVGQFLKGLANNTFRYIMTRFLVGDYNQAQNSDPIPISLHELLGWRRPLMKKWETTAAWEQSVGNIDRSLMGPYSFGQSSREDDSCAGAQTIHSWEYLCNHCEPGDEDMKRRFQEDGGGRYHDHNLLMEQGSYPDRPPAGPVRLIWGTVPFDDDLSQRQGGKLLEYQSTPLYLHTYKDDNGNVKNATTEGDIDRATTWIGLETFPGNDKIIKHYIKKTVPLKDLHAFHFNTSIKAHYLKGPPPDPFP
jgi:hypothetical protein